jgi:hypothetical protein
MNRSTNRSVSSDRKSRPYSVSVTAWIWKPSGISREVDEACLFAC